MICTGDSDKWSCVLLFSVKFCSSLTNESYTLPTMEGFSPRKFEQTECQSRSYPGRIRSPPASVSAPSEGEGATDPAARTTTVDLKRLMETGDPALYVEIYPGDRVTVRRAGIVYVVGAVLPWTWGVLALAVIVLLLWGREQVARRHGSAAASAVEASPEQRRPGCAGRDAAGLAGTVARVGTSTACCI